MADTWFTDITHFLDGNGEIIAEPAQAIKLGEYLTAIIFMASYPDLEYPTGYRVICRRRPNRKSCQPKIVGFIDPETDDIMWMCPKCNDRGIISNWRDTLWNMSDADNAFH